MKKQGKPKITNPLNPILTKALTEMPLDELKDLKASTAPKGIDIADLIAYRKKGLTLEEIGTLTGCTKQTVSERLQEANLEGLESFREHKDIVLEHQQREIVKSLTGAKIKDMSGLQLITGAAILQDKIQVIRGQATEIIDHRIMVLDLNRAIEQLRAEQGAPTDVEEIPDIQVVDAPEKFT